MRISPLPRFVRHEERGVVYAGNVIDEVRLLRRPKIWIVRFLLRETGYSSRARF